MNCKQLNSIMLEEILSSVGCLPTKQNEKEAWFLNPFGSETEASFKLDKRKNQWFLFSEFKGGNTLDFIRRYFNYSIPEALSWANDRRFFSFHHQTEIQEPNYKITEISEIENWNLKKYLKERGLSKKVYPFLKEIKFTISSKKLYAIGFQNLSEGWELRNSFYKGSILKKDISLIKNNSNKIFVFEGFIDALSFVEIQHNFDVDILVLNSIALINKAKIHIENYSEIFLFMDNDKAGTKAKSDLISLFPRAKDYSFYYKDFKDLNDFLINKNNNKFIK